MATKQARKPVTPAELRERAGLTFEQVVTNPAAVVEKTLTRLEGGKPGITPRTLARLATIYDQAARARGRAGVTLSELSAAYMALLDGKVA